MVLKGGGMIQTQTIGPSDRIPADENRNLVGYRDQQSPLTLRKPTRPTESLPLRLASPIPQRDELASAALDRYNRGKDVKFELVEVLDRSTMRRGGCTWHHFGFKAKPAHAHSPQLFFAEVKRWGLCRMYFAVTCCRILDPTTDKVTGSCHYCNPDTRILHPGEGMQANLPISPILIPATEQTQGEVEGGRTRSCLLQENHPLSPSGTESKEGGSSQMENISSLPDKNQCSSAQKCMNPQGQMLLPLNKELMSKVEVSSPIQMSVALGQTFNWKDHHPGPWRGRPNQSELQAYMRIGEERSKIALEHYNKEKNAKFELEEFLACFCFSNNDRCWRHINFKAKPKYSPHSDSSIKVFFGELLQEGKVSLRATCCRILDLTLDKVSDDCGHCPPHLIVHPGDDMRIGIRSKQYRHYERRRLSKLWSDLLQDNSMPPSGSECTTVGSN